MQARSVQKYLVASPRKLREIVPLIKKLKPADALEQLPFFEKRAAEPLYKVIKTAIANAKEKGANEKDLIFKEIQINEGPRLKRWRAGARGRAKPYKRRMSHIRIVVGTETEKPKGQKVENVKTKKEVSKVGKKASDPKRKTKKNTKKEAQKNKKGGKSTKK